MPWLQLGRDVGSSLMPHCPWATTEPAITYHDKEWGVPVHDDRLLFEFLILEGAQAGLSWITILKKRNAYRKAFDKFRHDSKNPPGIFLDETDVRVTHAGEDSRAERRWKRKHRTSNIEH